MQWIKNYLYKDQYYKITKEGDQRRLQYHFIKPYDSYEIVVPYKVLGLSVYLNSKTYVIPPHSFFIQGNELFHETFFLWLCKHYLFIQPCQGTTTIIDENIDIHTSSFLKVNNAFENDINVIKE
jgi:hypothetical protein